MGELGLGGKRHGVGVERRNENTGLRTPSAGGYRCAFIFKPGFSVVEIPQFHKTSRTVTDVLAGGGPIPTLVPPCPPYLPALPNIPFLIIPRAFLLQISSPILPTG